MYFCRERERKQEKRKDTKPQSNMSLDGAPMKFTSL